MVSTRVPPILRRTLAAVLIIMTLVGGARATAVEPETQADDPTPPRLSYTAGSVSFWRPGGDDWGPAQVNTPLAEGDELYTARDGNLELQVGARAFVRAWGDTQLGLIDHEPGFQRFRVAAGHIVLDLGTPDPGTAVEIATPAAGFTIDRPGYYRVDVSAERTSFSARRSGRATMTTASGPVAAVEAGEAVVVDAGIVRRLAAPDLDVWDRWNDARTASLVAPVSAQHVPAQVYGGTELDRYGAWRSDPTYGSVWVPAGVAAGWAPYSTGRWLWDPRFGWTWLDAAPWGWAPYHYGRWVSLGGVWAWAPGPMVVRPVYAPALVAFFGTPAVGVHLAGPSIGWVALGWGEPVMPWWGRPHFVGRPWWGGWGGPRVQHVTVHRNVTVVNAVVVVRSDHFGRRAVHEARVARPDLRRLQPARGRLDVKPRPESFRGRDGHAQRPPDGQVSRRVVSPRSAARRPDSSRVTDDGREARPEDRRQARPDARRPEVRRDGTRDRVPGTPPPATPRVAPPRPDAPRDETPRRQEPPRVGAPRPETPRPAPPRAEPPRPDGPRVPPPRGVDPPRTEPPAVGAARPEPPRVAPLRGAPRRPGGSNVPPPDPASRQGVAPLRPEAPRGESRVEIRRPGPSRIDGPRIESARRAAAPAGERRPDAVRPVIQRRPEARSRSPLGPAGPQGRPGRSEPQGRGRQGR
jgi:hypothetical protein